MTPPSSQLFSLAGRRVLITGSSQGIGLAFARGMAEAGASVVLNGRDTAKLERAAAELRAGGCAIETSAFDVTDETSVRAAAARLGPIDVLVNNAGIHRRAPLIEMKLEDWEAVLRGNLTSVFLVTRALAPAMIERRRGKIINICSVTGRVARPTIANYSASKAALEMLTRAMAVEWGRHNIQANGIAPGYMVTELNRTLVQNPEFDAWIRGRTPLGRWGKPEELIGSAVFLASAASDFMTGQVLYVDGGILAAL